ncbi:MULTISPECIES: DinB family protein [Cytobacillus]|uniref:DinB family protein n=1 Tax=Cytobacillus stercorigallinarum TaxID=2762240 RepID=A0ABR8QIY5_9BACI|nr:DinB family protein [Cytobacillus stercorigallinarum]MBD7935479.1 DinB family protein [Cytobacillus stercorigallinarum]
MIKRHTILFNQLHTYREEVLAIVKDVSAEQAEIIPSGFRNNIRWHMGHIYLDQFLWIQSLTKEAIIDLSTFQSFFGFGTTPADFNEHTPSYENLIGLLREQPTVIEHHYGDILNREYQPIDMGMCTIEDVLIRTIFHEGIHMQSINIINRLIKEGSYDEYPKN